MSVCTELYDCCFVLYAVQLIAMNAVQLVVMFVYCADGLPYGWWKKHGQPGQPHDLYNMSF